MERIESDGGVLAVAKVGAWDVVLENYDEEDEDEGFADLKIIVSLTRYHANAARFCRCAILHYSLVFLPED